MIMEDQGIMALPQGQAMPGPGPTAQGPETNPEVQDAFEQARMQVDPVEFGDELLTQGEAADPETVTEFRQMLDEMDLPAEVIDALGVMVDTVLAEPEKYAEIRENFLKEGVPEDLLPPQFDAAFFGALNIALDQLNANLSPTPAAFAQGGEVKMSPVASGIAQLGRKGDTQLAHITMAESRMLRRAGGSGTINPKTGLREYFISKVFKSVGNALKKVGSAVSKAVKGVVNGVKKFANSTVGRILTTVALGFFLGPAAAGLLGVSSAAGVAAISGFVGGFGSSVLAGKNLRESLKAGAIGGITAGAMSGITGGAAAFEGAPAGTPTPSFTESVQQQWDKFTKGIGSLTTPSEVAPGEGGVPTSEMAPAAPAPAELQAGAPATPPPTAGLPSPIKPPEFLAVNQPGVDMSANLAGRSITDVTAGTTGQLPSGFYQQTPTDFMRSIEPRTFGAPAAAAPAAAAPTGLPNAFEQAYQTQGFNQAIGLGETTPFATSPSNVAIERSMLGMTGPVETAQQFISSPVETGSEIYGRYVSPTGIQEAGKADAMRVASNTRAEALQNGFDQATANKMALDAYNKALPGTFARYAPITALGIGALGLAGGFQAKDPGRPGILPTETGEELLAKYPEKYGVTPGGGQIFYGGYGGRKFAKGGIASLEEKYPRKTGPIDGPGTGTSDSIPAMLSDGEFVFTAKAVRAMGNGSRRKGAKRMYALMKKLEGAK
jgi:hypothetical protein